MPNTLWHITTQQNWTAIQKHGYLIPSIGNRSVMWGEPDARIYFFGTYQEAEEGWIAWMEQAMTESEDGDDVPCVILEIKASAVHDLIAVQFEWQATNPVPITAVLNVIEL